MTEVLAETALEALERARELLSEPSHWAQNEFAYDQNGDADDGDNATEGTFEPVCFCALGAISWVTTGEADWDEIPSQAKSRATALLESTLPPRNPDSLHKVAVWNDVRGRTHEVVIAAFDAAIIKAKEERS